jgi:hypothetical protein
MWAKETYVLGQEFAYGSLPGFTCNSSRAVAPIALGAQYANAAEKIVREQLAKSGFRLAGVLNQALAAK